MLKKLLKVLAILILWIVGSVMWLFLAAGYHTLQVPAYLPSKSVSVDQWEGGYVGANGTWTIEGQEHAFPLNTSEIDCFRRLMTCNEAIARLSTDRSTWSPAFLNAGNETYSIRTWSNDLLVYVSETPCVEYAYTVVRATASVTGVRRLKPQPGADCSGLVDPQLLLRLSDGFEVWRTQNDRHQSPIVYLSVPLLLLVVAGLGIRRVVRRRRQPASDPLTRL